MIRTSTSVGRLRHMFDLSGTLKSFLVWPRVAPSGTLEIFDLCVSIFLVHLVHLVHLVSMGSGNVSGYGSTYRSIWVPTCEYLYLYLCLCSPRLSVSCALYTARFDFCQLVTSLSP